MNKKAGPKTAAVVGSTGGSSGVSKTPTLLDPSTVRNKMKRQEIVQRREQLKALIRKKARLRRKKEEDADPSKREKRLQTNQQKTLDNMRVAEDSMVQDDDEEIIAEEEQDEFAPYFQQGKPPKIIVTTSRRASSNTLEFANEVATIFPQAEFIKRESNYDIKHFVKFAGNRDYTDLIIINEDRKTPNAMTIVHLPDGPTAYFKLTSVKSGKDIHNHGRMTAHEPELILNNFNTRLGHTIGRQFAALFPHVPQFQGRQVCTFHNQRDFIFFRRHRYIFANDERADMQELGPRFTLKLQWLQKGTFDTKQGDYEWMFKPEMATSRRRFFL